MGLTHDKMMEHENQAAYNEIPARAQVITDASAVVQKRISELEHVVGLLKERLSIVLRPSYPRDVPSGIEKDTESSSPLRDEFLIIGSRLSKLCRELEDINDRLE